MAAPGAYQASASYQPPPPPSGWSAGRIVAVVAGAVLAFCSLGLFGAGGAALWAEGQRDGGYIDLGSTPYRTSGYALSTGTFGVHAEGAGWDAARALVGSVRIRIQAANPATPAFIGIAPARAAAGYLDGVAYSTVTGTTGGTTTYVSHSGTAPAVAPARAGIWSKSAAGPGVQTLTWPVESGDWRVIAMNADGSRPVSVRVAVAVTMPWLPWVAAGLLVAGVIFLAGGVLLIVIPIRRASRPGPAAPPGAGGGWS